MGSMRVCYFSYSMKICDGNMFTRVAPEQLYDVVLTCR